MRALCESSHDAELEMLIKHYRASGMLSVLDHLENNGAPLIRTQAQSIELSEWIATVRSERKQAEANAEALKSSLLQSLSDAVRSDVEDQLWALEQYLRILGRLVDLAHRDLNLISLEHNTTARL
jgi:hypothetical protein